jgi:hypothetical protein
VTSHPTAHELLDAVASYIEQIAPKLQNRDAFLARVAANALGVVRRELAEGSQPDRRAEARLRALMGEDGDVAALNARLCEQIRAGAFDDREDALLDHLRASAIDQVRIDQPGYSGLAAALARATTP